MKQCLAYILAVAILGSSACSSYTWRTLSRPFKSTGPISDQWETVGRTPDGTEVFVHRGTLHHPSPDIIIVDAKTIVRGREYLDKLEFDCPRYKFRILNTRSSGKTRWRGIIHGSPSKLIHNAFCLDNKKPP